MAELDQEFRIPTFTDGGEDLQDDDSIDLSLLRLDSFNSSHTANHHNHCTSCGFPGSSSSNKRRSPDLSAPTMADGGKVPKKPKKLFHDPQDTTTNTDHASSLRGFSKISLPLNIQEPQSQTTTPLPVFRRCISDPTHPPLANVVPQSPPESTNTVGTNMVTTPIGSASLPPRPPFRRTVSDPSPSKGFSRSSSSNDLDESPSHKALKKMRDCMRQLNLWWNEILPEEEMCVEEDVKGDEENIATEAQVDHGTDCDEAISVERAGECLIIHFKCPCSKGYQILLSGSSCYYKLM